MPGFPHPSSPAWATRWLCLAGFLALHCGCGGGSGGLGGPTDLAVKPAQLPLNVLLEWQDPSNQVDGYWVELKAPTTSFQAIGTLIPAQDNGAQLTFTTAPAEGTDLTFRVRAAKGGSFSAYSNNADFTWLNVPTGLLAALAPAGGGVTVSWSTTGSQFANGVLIQRAIGVPLGAWQDLATVPYASGSYLDTSVQETANYIYQVSNCLNGTAMTMAVEAGQVYVPCLPPTGLAAVPQGGGYHLTWQNNSPVATEVLVKRAAGALPPAILATLAPGATSYDDLAVPEGCYNYYVGASVGNPLTEGDTPPIQVCSVNAPGALKLTSTVVLPPSQGLESGLLTPQGTWDYLVGIPVPANCPYDYISTIGMDPGQLPPINPFAVDPQGNIHTMVEVQSSTDPATWTLVHQWTQGGTWQTESVVTGTLMPAYASPSGSMARFQFLLDSTGSPVALVDQVTAEDPGGASTRTLNIYSRTGGIWTSESLAGSISPDLTGLIVKQLALDASDQPHVLAIPETDLPYEFSRGTGGVWQGSQIPTPALDFYNSYYSVQCIWADSGNATLLYDQAPASPTSAETLTIMSKVAGVWQAPSAVFNLAKDPVGFPVVAASADRSRTLVAIGAEEGTVIYSSGPSGWGGTLLPLVSPTATGFDAANRYHLLFYDYNLGLTDYHE